MTIQGKVAVFKCEKCGTQIIVPLRIAGESRSFVNILKPITCDIHQDGYGRSCNESWFSLIEIRDGEVN